MDDGIKVLCVVILFVFILYRYHKDVDEWFKKYWDMWAERNKYFDESVKWKTKYFKLKRKKKVVKVHD